MRKRFLSIFISMAAGVLASAAILALAHHAAGIAWAAPEAQPLAATLVVGGTCGATIQGCVDAASPGDEVHVPAGLYTESVTVAKSISLTGDLSSTTIIHALDNQRVMTITTASVYLADLMLTGGVFTSTGSDYSTNCGGGLRIYAAGPTELHNVSIISNTAYCGGGLGAYGSQVTLDGVAVMNNTAGVGGGVSARYLILAIAGGSIRNNIGTFLAGGIEQHFGQMTMSGGEVFSNSTDYFGGGIVVFGAGAEFTQTAGSIAGNTANRSGGGLMDDGGSVWLLGGTIMSNSAPNGGGIAIFSETGAPGDLFLSGGTVAGNGALAAGGGVYLTGVPSAFTQTSGSIERNAAIIGGGLYQDNGSAAWLLGGQVFSNNAGSGGGIAVAGPDSWFTQSGGQIAANSSASIGGGMYIGYTGSVTVSISGGLFLSNSASGGAGAIAIDRGVLVIMGSRILSNTGGSGPGALAQFTSGAPVSVTIATSCIASNGPLTSVVNASGPTIDARGNWWGAASGPAGAGPGTGDSVSPGVDFSGFLTVPPLPGCPAPTADLSVTRDGTGSGIVSSTPAGINCGVDCSGTFYQNTVVTLTALPSVSSSFAGWTGACSGTGSCAVSMTQPAQVTATFSLNSSTLTVANAGNGSGLVSSTPPGISCGATCSADFTDGTVVTLTAIPSVSSSFAGWTGACAGNGSCVVTITQPAQVTATFTLKAYTLTVARAGNGAGIVTSLPAGIGCGATCSASFNYGTVVTLTATPSVSSTLAGWSGACAGIGACIVTITQPAQVTATFSLNAYTLTVGRVGSGSGVVTSLPAGIDCGNTCSSAFNYGTVVTLTAKPAPASTFAGWQGACAGLGACLINLTQATVVTATFSLRGHHGPVVLPGTGTSTIYSIPIGRNCGQTCAAAFGYSVIPIGTAAPSGWRRRSLPTS